MELHMLITLLIAAAIVGLAGFLLGASKRQPAPKSCNAATCPKADMAQRLQTQRRTIQSLERDLFAAQALSTDLRQGGLDETDLLNLRHAATTLELASRHLNGEIAQAAKVHCKQLLNILARQQPSIAERG